MRKRTLLVATEPRKRSAGFTHLDEQGQARMVDVGAKPITLREAKARALVRMQAQTLRAILAGELPKGEVLAVARVAGIAAAKRTDELIPLCHTLPLDAVEVEFAALDATTLEIRASARVHGRTGVEMEALVAASVAALTVYDMCKAVDREMEIASLQLVEKRGGRSGTYRRKT
jgi:cyclic pyranopterin phosphate synthase